MALALGVADKNERVAAEAEAFLKEQTQLAREQRELTRLQSQELSHELGLRHWSLWVRHSSGLLKLALELSAGLLLLALVAGLSLMVWNAVHSEGLIIESFSVPPDMAARGVTGEVVASQMLDQLITMQNVTSPAVRRNPMPTTGRRPQGGNTRYWRIHGRGLSLPARLAGQ